MADNQDNTPNADQGKPSTAETNVTYQRDDAALRNSSTTSTADSDDENTTHEDVERVDDVFDGNLDTIEINQPDADK
ncbi:hypothetical protein [Adhaeribacter pallidiroseus]|uniref:Uncharacterized protein n=1 Tax=Adhaeribacter pallidiroseus TaxID=2072847 RepID=A0A369QIK5_9BACT|nr:hypothetical protein [Adhaeribacter pallidiroseus]RDC62709.1 hypothetical protein AHMF7616_01303 [Adhaeribacter pallidiroseus]